MYSSTRRVFQYSVQQYTVSVQYRAVYGFNTAYSSIPTVFQYSIQLYTNRASVHYTAVYCFSTVESSIMFQYSVQQCIVSVPHKEYNVSVQYRAVYKQRFRTACSSKQNSVSYRIQQYIYSVSVQHTAV